VSVHTIHSSDLERGRYIRSRGPKRLRVTLQFSKRDADTFTVRLADTIIASYKGSKRNGLRRGECGIPSRAVLHAGDFLALLVFVGARWLMLDELA
jgi:hypothetical protein